MTRRKKHRPPLLLRMMQFAFARLGLLFPDFFAALAYRLWFTAQRFRRPEAEHAAAGNAEHASININNVDIRVWSWGHGAPVLFIHGWSGRGTQVLNFLKPLLQAGYRVISFDARAHGETAGRTTSMLVYLVTHQAA
jgi:predicted alpha/beta-fold hydrolase